MPVILETSRCRLVPLAAEHEARYIELANHPQIRDRVNNTIPYGKPQFEELLESTRGSTPHFAWVIETGGYIVGVILFASVGHPQRFQGGYWIDPKHQGLGLATEALSLVTKYLHTQANAVRIQALVEPDNPASSAVLTKCGFVNEGLLKRFYPSRYRGLLDVYMYAAVNA